MDGHLAHYVGGPSPLYFAERLTENIAAARKIYLKREELNHTGAHKVNNVLGQICRGAWARGASSPRPAPACMASPPRRCARASASECIVYMGSVDVERQNANVFRMQMLGATVRSRRFRFRRRSKDAMNEALRDWVMNVGSTFLFVSARSPGPHPYPMMVRDFQSIIGRETREQMQQAEGRLPDLLVACIGGGSNAMGLFHPFLDDRQYRDLRRRSGRPRSRKPACTPP